MWQAEVAVDLDAIRANVDRLARSSPAELMAVVKADGYGHGAVPAARAALAGGASMLGVCTLEEAAELREAGLTAPILAWLWSPGQAVAAAIEQRVDLGVSSAAQLATVASAEGTAVVHLKIDTGLSRGGVGASEWLSLLDRAAKAQADGSIEIVGIWSHLANADTPEHDSIDAQLSAFKEALETAGRYGVNPRIRHLANSAALLTRPDTHFDLVRAGIACYGLSPIPGREFGLRPAMTARAKVIGSKRVPAGAGVSYGHTYVMPRAGNVAVVPIGYADGIPRHASSVGPVQINGRRYRIAGRVCMDQFVVDTGDDEVREGDEVVLFGPGDGGEPTVDDWADAVGTINYEIVTRIGSARVARVYHGG